MKKSRFTEEQIAFALRQAEGGASDDRVAHSQRRSASTTARSLRASVWTSGRTSAACVLILVGPESLQIMG